MFSVAYLRHYFCWFWNVNTILFQFIRLHTRRAVIHSYILLYTTYLSFILSMWNRNACIFLLFNFSNTVLSFMIRCFYDVSICYSRGTDHWHAIDIRFYGFSYFLDLMGLFNWPSCDFYLTYMYKYMLLLIWQPSRILCHVVSLN
jgi:hypothetical protein